MKERKKRRRGRKEENRSESLSVRVKDITKLFWANQ